MKIKFTIATLVTLITVGVFLMKYSQKFEDARGILVYLNENHSQCGLAFQSSSPIPLIPIRGIEESMESKLFRYHVKTVLDPKFCRTSHSLNGMHVKVTGVRSPSETCMGFSVSNARCFLVLSSAEGQ